MSEVVLWKADALSPVSNKVSDPTKIASYALQLRERERQQIARNILEGNFEVATTFVWSRTMSLLKRQLGSLGSEFIGELLQRPDIDEYSDITSAISDIDAISLALDLGVVTSTQAVRLRQSQQIVAHFASLHPEEVDEPDDEEMTREEAVNCFRICVQGVLGKERISAAQNFKGFREKLASETLDDNGPEIQKLNASPYFFMKTTISILITLFKSEKGARFEHAARNASLIIPAAWVNLREPEKWQIGQAYAEEFNEGNKEIVRALRNVLLKVSGFDYVPENLRSSSFIKVAQAVLKAHEEVNNFYNEATPIKELANLGTSIPGPALADCITAILCVRLGNYYGRSTNAQRYALTLIDGISKDRWKHYFNGRLIDDRRILATSKNSPFPGGVNLIQMM